MARILQQGFRYRSISLFLNTQGTENYPLPKMVMFMSPIILSAAVFGLGKKDNKKSSRKKKPCLPTAIQQRLLRTIVKDWIIDG